MGFWEDAKYIASQDPAATGPLQVFAPDFTLAAYT